MAMVCLGAVLLGAMALGASGQDVRITASEVQREAPEWLHAVLPDPNDPAVQEWAQAQRERRDLEGDLRQLRSRYFRSRNEELRQVGLSELRRHAGNPTAYPVLLEVFEHDSSATRSALLGLFAEQETDEADATLAWLAVFDRDADVRGLAEELLADRVAQVGVSERVKLVVAAGLKKEHNREVTEAAQLAGRFKIAEAIPLMILAQGGGDTRGASGERRGSLGWILVGRQIAFISDLTPVVSDSAVAFDPTVSVVTEGVVIEIDDAVVYTYRVDVHNALIGLTTELWGERTDRLGWDIPAWWEWYKTEFEPAWAARGAAGAG